MTVTIVLALATLGNTAQIEIILIAKASKEGDITLQFCGCYQIQTWPMLMSLKAIDIESPK